MANEAFKLSYNLKFQLEKRRKDGILQTENLPIQLVITYKSQRLKLLAGYRIDLNKWDDVNGKVKKGASNEKGDTWNDINNHLNRLKTVIDDFFDTCKVNKVFPTLEEIKQVYKDALGDTTIVKETYLSDIFKLYILKKGAENNWTAATIRKITTVCNTLFEFDNKLKLENIDTEQLQSYKTFLEDKKQYRSTTIAKQIKFIKGFLKWTLKNGYKTDTSFLEFAPKLKGVAKDNEHIVFLTLDELKHLENFNTGKDYLERVKDVFIFCCFSGIRYSDVFNLTRADLKDDKIVLTTVKTIDNLSIQLNDTTRRILAKYRDVPFDDNKILPVISNQKMNKYLKELCLLAGFNEPIKKVFHKGGKRVEEIKFKYQYIGTHTARRSFICNCVMLGIPVEVIIKWTGHKDYEAMSPYLKILEDKKQQEMNKFN